MKKTIIAVIVAVLVVAIGATGIFLFTATEAVIPLPKLLFFKPCAIDLHVE